MAPATPIPPHAAPQACDTGPATPERHIPVLAGDLPVPAHTPEPGPTPTFALTVEAVINGPTPSGAVHPAEATAFATRPVNAE